MRLTYDHFERDEQVGIIGTDVTATIARRLPRLCAACGHPVYLVTTDDGEQFSCCEPGLLRLRLN
jgi:hypothetical protein